ncbi:MAG: PEP-CTERM sorting domain-containing protein [Gemmatimonadota bacterium]
MAEPLQAQLSTTSPNCDTGSVLTDFNPNADDCLGAYEGNDKQQESEIIQAMVDAGWLNSTDGANVLGYTDAEDGEPNPFTSDPQGSTGTLTLAAPLTGDYALILKVGTQFSIYYFENLVNVSSIYYTTAGTNLNGSDRPQGLSHGGLISVPEPGSTLLLLTGLLGLAAVGWKRRRFEAV